MIRHERERSYRVAPAIHWALIPLLAGIIIGVAFSTLLLLQPYTAVTNVYLELPSPERGDDSLVSRFGESRDLQRLLNELGAARGPQRGAGSPPAKLADEADAKAPVYYAVVMSHRHSADQLKVLRDTWTREIPSQKVGFYINSEEEEEEPTEEGVEDRHYGEIESSETVVELSSTGANFYADVVSHVCRNKLNRTKWYLLVGDDVYVKHKELETQLQWYENMPAFGYLGKRNSDKDSGECAEGPGVVLSQPVLSQLCRQLESCRQRGEGVGGCLTNTLGHNCNQLNLEVRKKFILSQ